MTDILLIEDDASLAEGIDMALTGEDMQVTIAHTAQNARRFLNDHPWDLIILDLNLPDENGFSLLKQLRETSDVPVIILTANDMETDVVRGLELGADDYMTKPFSLAILRARIRAQCRRQLMGEADTFKSGAFVFNFAKQTFMKDGKSIELSNTEQRLLRLLTARPGVVCTRRQLETAIWETDVYVNENALSVTVRRLRQKLDDDVPPRRIDTVYGMGYVWRDRP